MLCIMSQILTAKQARASQAKAAALEKPATDDQYGQHHVAIDPEPVVLGDKDASGQEPPLHRTPVWQAKFISGISYELYNEILFCVRYYFILKRPNSGKLSHCSFFIWWKGNS